MTRETIEILPLVWANLPRLVWAWLTGRRFHLWEVPHPSSTLAGPIRAFGRWLAARGAMGWVKDLFPPTTTFFLETWVVEWPDMFRRLEGRARQLMVGLDETVDPVYGQALNHLACIGISRWLIQVAAFRHLDRLAQERSLRLVGAPAAVPDLYAAYFGAPPAFEVVTVRPSGLPVTLLVMGLLVPRILAWIAARVRLGARAAAPVLLGVDFVDDPRHFAMVTEAMDGPEELVMVLRSRLMARQKEARAELAAVRAIEQEAVVLPPRAALKLAAIVLADAPRLVRLCRSLPAPVAFEACKLMFRRVVYRALFQAQPCRFFLSKDDYNPEHVLRTRELRASGGHSIGIAHGIPLPELITPLYRHVDFDTYLTFGRFPFHLYRSTWPEDMRVVAVGSFGFSRDQVARMTGPRSRDVVVFVSRLPDEERFMMAVHRLAERLPDRRIIVKPKYPPGHSLHHPLFEAPGPANLKVRYGMPYELMLECGYFFNSGNTTTIVETLQTGRPAFVWDSYDNTQDFCYRDFPGLCVRDGDAVADRILAIELGRETWRPELYAQLTETNCPAVADRLRAIIGRTKGPQ